MIQHFYSSQKCFVFFVFFLQHCTCLPFLHPHSECFDTNQTDSRTVDERSTFRGLIVFRRAGKGTHFVLSHFKRVNMSPRLQQKNKKNSDVTYCETPRKKYCYRMNRAPIRTYNKCQLHLEFCGECCFRHLSTSLGGKKHNSLPMKAKHGSENRLLVKSMFLHAFCLLLIMLRVVYLSQTCSPTWLLVGG